MVLDETPTGVVINKFTNLLTKPIRHQIKAIEVKRNFKIACVNQSFVGFAQNTCRNDLPSPLIDLSARHYRKLLLETMPAAIRTNT